MGTIRILKVVNNVFTAPVGSYVLRVALPPDYKMGNDYHVTIFDTGRDRNTEQEIFIGNCASTLDSTWVFHSWHQMLNTPPAYVFIRPKPNQ